MLKIEPTHIFVGNNKLFNIMRKGYLKFNKNLTFLVNFNGQLLFSKNRQFYNTRYKRVRYLISHRKVN